MLCFEGLYFPLSHVVRNEFNKHNHNIININCSIIQFKTPSLEIRGTNVSSKEFLLEKTSLIELSVSVQDYLTKFFDAFSISPDAHGT